MVQDLCIVSVKGEQEVICIASNGDTVDDFEWSQLPHITSIIYFVFSGKSQELLKLESSNFVRR